MIAFHSRMAWRSLRRTPGFTIVMIAALSLGVATWYVQHRVMRTMLTTEPAVPDDVHDVALARRTPPITGFGRFGRAMPSVLLAASDVQALLGTGIPAHETATFTAPGLLATDSGPPEIVRVRYATRDLFAIFRIPFAEGGAWDASEDAGGLDGRAPGQVVVDSAVAERLFPGTSAIGHVLTVDGTRVTITGVVSAAYRGQYRLYDLRNLIEPPSPVYLPLSGAAYAHAMPDLLYPRGARGGRFADLRASEDGWLEMWVELPSDRAKTAFTALAGSHLARDRAAGRADAPTEVVLRSAARWRAEVIPNEGTVNVWPVISALALVASALNLVRLLTGKFTGRSRDFGLLRAFGARRGELVGQILLEAGLLGLTAGVVGVLIGSGMMPLASRSIAAVTKPSPLGASDAVAAIVVSTAAALAAAIYPAWRIGLGTPASQLRRR